jgi:hypothetical protein
MGRERGMHQQRKEREKKQNTREKCTPREKVQKFVKDLVDLELTNLNICITNRPEADIIISLNSLPFTQISIHREWENAGHRRLHRFLRSHRYKMKGWRTADKELVIEVLTYKVDGM